MCNVQTVLQTYEHGPKAIQACSLPRPLHVRSWDRVKSMAQGVRQRKSYVMVKIRFCFFWSLVVLLIGVFHVLTVLTIEMGWRSPVAKGFQGWHQLPTIFFETHWPIPIFQSELADVLATYHHRFHHGCIGACCAGDISGFAIPWFRTLQALIFNPAMGYHGTPHKVSPLKDFPIMEFHGWSCWSSFFVLSQPYFRLHLPNSQLWLWAGVRRQPSCRARMRRNTGLKEKTGFCEKLVGTQAYNFQRNHDVSTAINFAGAQLSDEPNIFIIVWAGIPVWVCWCLFVFCGVPRIEPYLFHWV